jgi:hypothetical protein
MYCQYSGKQRFPTAMQACRAAEFLMRRKKGKAQHYQCDVCKDWHIANATNLVRDRRRRSRLGVGNR